MSQGNADYAENSMRLEISQNISWHLKWDFKWWIRTDQVNMKTMKLPFWEVSVHAGTLIPQIDWHQKKTASCQWMQSKNKWAGKCARIKLKTAGRITGSVMW